MPEKPENASSEIRSFIAIDISSEVRRALDDFIRELKQADTGVKWVRAGSIHLTLKFLGNIAPKLVPKIKDAMQSAAADTAPFEVRVEGTGAFPNLKKSRVFWAGVVEPTGALAKLAGRLEDELKPLGFEPEGREFRPHLTLGRVRQGGRADAAADAISRQVEKSFGGFQATELILFKSDLQRDGAVYTKLEKVVFKS